MKKNPLIAGSVILFGGSMIASFGNYLYHLSMGRMLGAVDYGTLVSLISIFALLSIPIGVVGTVVVKYVSTFSGKSDSEGISSFYQWINRKLAFVYVIAAVVLFFASPAIASFLHIESVVLIWIIIAVTILGVYQTIKSSFLQGCLRFTALSVIGIAQSLIKLIIALLLVYLGSKVFGAVASILLSTLIALSFLNWQVKKIIIPVKNKSQLDTTELRNYGLSVLMSNLAFTSFITTDVVLAKHFLDPHQAGIYAALSTLGKIIIFASSPVITVMFPLISASHAKGSVYSYLFKFSALIVLAISLIIGLIYYIYPELMIKLLYGKDYLEAGSNLFLFAVFSGIYALASLVANYFLSVHEKRVAILSFTAALVQVVLIYFFHKNMLEIVWISTITLCLLLISYLLYYLIKYGSRKEKTSFSDSSRLQTRTDDCS